MCPTEYPFHFSYVCFTANILPCHRATGNCSDPVTALFAGCTCTTTCERLVLGFALTKLRGGCVANETLAAPGFRLYTITRRVQLYDKKTHLANPAVLGYVPTPLVHLHVVRIGGHPVHFILHMIPAMDFGEYKLEDKSAGYIDIVDLPTLDHQSALKYDSLPNTTVPISTLTTNTRP